ncbi:hypothetical protein ACQEVF_56785 [Nonomuraea polychroma]|uniref:hypothetical protein n=1 Tax=Nonomuraea polychroma TaxID=46176 RepID=UPI003D8BCB81
MFDKSADADATADARGEAFVQSWRRRLPDWLLMYSPHKRRLVAFYRGYHCPPAGLCVEAEYPEELLQQMSCEVHALWQSPAHLASLSRTLVGSAPDTGGGAG